MPEKKDITELEKSYAIVETWFKDLSETSVAGMLDRGVLRDVLKDLGANLDQDPKILARLKPNHYSFNIREKALKSIFGENYPEISSFCESFNGQHKSIGPKQFFVELIALAATTEEIYPQAYFVTRTTAQVVDGKFRAMGITDKNLRLQITVPGYNTITYAFHDAIEDVRVGDLPFAPFSVPPEFPQKAWEFMKSLKK